MSKDRLRPRQHRLQFDISKRKTAKRVQEVVFKQFAPARDTRFPEFAGKID